ncbi:hypothetical protein GCM10010448_26670 [Streptomyces glomeratus]|uniref:Uncharacterized protein n=1 Tax=Streptomyces glomeratus TaxID=284452 RepID=A0ABP6LGZ2_9ACTN
MVMPNCQRARVSGAKARSTSSSPYVAVVTSGSLPPFVTHIRSNPGAFVNAFTFTSNYGAYRFEVEQVGGP